MITGVLRQWNLLRNNTAILFPDNNQARHALIVGVLTTTVAVLEAMGVGAVWPFVSALVNPDSIQQASWWHWAEPALGNKTPDQIITYLGLLLVIVLLGKNALVAVQTVQIQKFTQKFFKNLSTWLFTTYINKPYKFFSGSNSAVIVKNVSVETRMIADQVIAPGFMIVSELIVVALIVAVLFVFDPLLATMGLGSVVIILVITSRISRRLNRRYGQMREQSLGGMSKICQEAIRGITDVKVSGTEKYFSDIYKDAAERNARAAAKHNIVHQIPRLVLETILVLGVVGAVLVLDLRQNESGVVATFAMYVAAAYRLLPSINRIAGSAMHLRYFQASFDAIAPILRQAKNEPSTQKIDQIKPLDFLNEINIRGIEFSYVHDKPVLSNANLRVKKGEVIGIIGPSGAGKSTLIHILLGLLPFDKGAYLVDGKPLHESDFIAWRKSIAYVPQHVFIADTTLAGNIALGIDEKKIDRDWLHQVVKITELTQLVKGLPSGLESEVGEQGAKLSGGQIQRIGLARALYRNVPILLLDEGTSALDLKTEERIITNLHSARSDKTIIMIAHRIASLQYCDRIYNLEHGNIGNPVSYQELTLKLNSAEKNNEQR